MFKEDREEYERLQSQHNAFIKLGWSLLITGLFFMIFFKVVGIIIIAIGILFLILAHTTNVKAAEVKFCGEQEYNIKHKNKPSNDYQRIIKEMDSKPAAPAVKCKRTTSFDAELSAIPLEDIKLSDKKIKNNFAMEYDVKLSCPRNNSKRQNYGNFVVIDTETTGISLKNSIIELSAIRFEDFKPVKAFTTLINPNMDIPPEASAVNNITNDMVANCPTIKQVLPAFIDFVGKSNLLGQNIMFDLKFIYKFGADFSEGNRKFYDTLEIAKKKLKRYNSYRPDNEYDVDNYKLATLCDYYNIDFTGAHRSLADCYATGLLFIQMLDNEYELI